MAVGVEYLLCYSSFNLNMQFFRRCEGLVFDELHPCIRGLAQMTSPPPLICSVPVFVPMKLSSYRCLQSSVCVTTMCLPFERVTSIKYACICIFITMILLNCLTLSMDSPSMCRLGSFSHMLCSRSDAEFRQCLPVVLQVHILSD